MRGHPLQRAKVPLAQSAHRREALGSRSEVERFRVDFRHGFLIVGTAAHDSLQLRHAGGRVWRIDVLEHIRRGERSEGVSAPLRIAELDFKAAGAQFLDQCADLPAREAILRNGVFQGDDIKQIESGIHGRSDDITGDKPGEFFSRADNPRTANTHRAARVVQVKLHRKASSMSIRFAMDCVTGVCRIKQSGGPCVCRVDDGD